MRVIMRINIKKYTMLISNRLLSMIAAGALVFGASAQSIYPGQHTGKLKLENRTPARATAFDLKEIHLLPGRFHDNLSRDSAWMANISIERLTHSFKNNAGVFAGREGGYESLKKYGGWESLDCDLRGHTTGHLMSAYGLMFAATGDSLFKAKGDSIVNDLATVQAALGNGYVSAFPEELINRNLRGQSVWAPWYTLHKIMSGLIDQYLLAGNEKALDVAVRMGDWAYGKLNSLSEETRALMLRNEFGGMNEAFYNLYAVTGDERYRQLAEFFYHNAVLDPLKNNDYDFQTKHTNTFIPKLIGECRNYELTGDAESRKIAEGFWNAVTDHHSFVTGSCSQKEHFFPIDKFSHYINGYTGESCCSYNMLKLSRHLFCWNPSAKIADYYERTLLNHILGQQDPATGMVCYFLPLQSGSYKLYSTPEQSFWCCVGSGFESHAKYAESIYFKGNNELFINLFIPSVLDSPETGIALRQETDFPYSDRVRVQIEKAPAAKMKISLRHPAWCDRPVVRVNGKRIAMKSAPSSYMTIDRRWKQGDVIEVQYPMTLHAEATPDNPDKAAILYGPVVLAASAGTEGVESFDSNPNVRNDYYTLDYRIPANLNDYLDIDIANPAAKIKPAGEPLTFTTPEGHILKPFFDTHRTRHIVYWNIGKSDK